MLASRLWSLSHHLVQTLEVGFVYIVQLVELWKDPRPNLGIDMICLGNGNG